MKQRSLSTTCGASISPTWSRCFDAGVLEPVKTPGWPVS
jgi:hypothetical protein